MVKTWVCPPGAPGFGMLSHQPGFRDAKIPYTNNRLTTLRYAVSFLYHDKQPFRTTLACQLGDGREPHGYYIFIAPYCTTERLYSSHLRVFERMCAFVGTCHLDCSSTTASLSMSPALACQAAIQNMMSAIRMHTTASKEGMPVTRSDDLRRISLPLEACIHWIGNNLEYRESRAPNSNF